MEDLIKLYTLLDSDTDMRKIFPKVPDIQIKIRSMPEYNNTPTNRFASYIIWSMIGEVFGNLQDKTDKWHEKNQENVEKLKKASATYFKEIKIAFEEDSFEKIVASSIILFSEVNIINKDCSIDTSTQD